MISKINCQEKKSKRQNWVQGAIICVKRREKTILCVYKIADNIGCLAAVAQIQLNSNQNLNKELLQMLLQTFGWMDYWWLQLKIAEGDKG